MSNVYVASDLHICHKSICKYRPEFKSPEEHNHALIENVLTTCGKRQIVVVTHIPSGISVCCDNGRSITEMREKAIKLLKSRLWAAQNMIHIDPEEVIVEFLNEEDEHD